MWNNNTPPLSCGGQVNSVKNWQNLHISNLKPDLLNTNRHTKFGENPLAFTQVIVWNENTDRLTYNGKTYTFVDKQMTNVKP